MFTDPFGLFDELFVVACVPFIYGAIVSIIGRVDVAYTLISRILYRSVVVEFVAFAICRIDIAGIDSEGFEFTLFQSGIAIVFTTIAASQLKNGRKPESFCVGFE